jgi:tripeptidyl-peptidase-2
MTFAPGAIVRRFISVPVGATFAELTVRAMNRDPPSARFIAHMVQLEPQSRYTKLEHEFAFMLATTQSADRSESTYIKYFSVNGGVTLELCLAQFWSSLGDTTVEVDLHFHGLLANGSAPSDTPILVSPGTDGVSRVDLMSVMQKEEISPSAVLDVFRRFVRPKEWTMSPLKERDVLPDSRQIHELVLTYEFKLPGGIAEATITPRFPKINNVLYDAVFDNVFLGGKLAIIVLLNCSKTTNEAIRLLF